MTPKINIDELMAYDLLKWASFFEKVKVKEATDKGLTEDEIKDAMYLFWQAFVAKQDEALTAIASTDNKYFNFKGLV